MVEWKDMKEHLLKGAEKNRSLAEFSEQFFNSTHECKCDDGWKIVVPEHLINLAGIRKELVIIEETDHFEVWSFENWKAENPGIKGFRGRVNSPG